MSRPLRERIQDRVRWLSALPRSRALVLLYHRVASLDADPWALAVPPQRFQEHLEVLQTNWKPTALSEVVRGIAHNRVAHGSVAVTFDDGYADNLYEAKPLLESYGVPATLYLASGAIGNPRVFWWDELARVLLAPGELPARLELPIAEQVFQWDLSGGATLTGRDASRLRDWRAWDPPAHPRHSLYYTLWETLRRSPENARNHALDALVRWAGANRSGTGYDRPLQAEEIKPLVDGSLIEVGAHTVRHPHLASLSPEEQRGEIVGSKLDLELRLDRPVRTFAYPFGGAGDYTRDTVGIVRSAGFESACSVAGGAVMRGADPYQLPRLYVQNWSGDELARQLRYWLGRPVRRA